MRWENVFIQLDGTQEAEVNTSFNQLLEIQKYKTG